MSFANIPNTFLRLLHAPSTDESIIINNNNNKSPPLQIQQSVTTLISEINVAMAPNSDNKVAMKKEDICTLSEMDEMYEDISISNVSVSDILPTLIDNVDSIQMTQLLLQLTGVEEEVLFAQNGYTKIKKICNTMQGELIEAISNDSKDSNKHSVTIKKCDKVLAAENISYADDDEMHFCVDDNMKKEKQILQYLTIDNVPTADYIVKYIDFFETDSNYYLVMESIYNDCNLLQFTETAHKYIKCGKFALKEYQKIIKYIFWQLSAVMHWLHDDMHCCHLNISMQNIILQNAHFIQHSDGSMIIDPSITAKLTDFSKSEVFTPNDNKFHCDKFSVLRDVQYLSPQLLDEQIFDARAADMWSLGMVLFHCAVGEALYSQIGIGEVSEPRTGTGYWAVITSNITAFLSTHNLIRYVNVKMLNIINHLLDIDDYQRINAVDILKDPWFKSYYKRYQQRIKKKSITQKKQLQQQQEQMNNFPFYVCNY